MQSNLWHTCLCGWKESESFVRRAVTVTLGRYKRWLMKLSFWGHNMMPSWQKRTHRSPGKGHPLDLTRGCRAIAKFSSQVNAVEFSKQVVRNAIQNVYFQAAPRDCTSAIWTCLHLADLLHLWKCTFFFGTDIVCVLGTQIRGITERVLLHWVVAFDFQ